MGSKTSARVHLQPSRADLQQLPRLRPRPAGATGPNSTQGSSRPGSARNTHLQVHWKHDSPQGNQSLGTLKKGTLISSTPQYSEPSVAPSCCSLEQPVTDRILDDQHFFFSVTPQLKKKKKAISFKMDPKLEHLKCLGNFRNMNSGV